MKHTLRIAIVGAGPAGLTAAHTLREVGYRNIEIFEASNDAGGKALSFVHDGRTHEMGAVWVSNGYDLIHRLASAYRVGIKYAEDLDVVRGWQVMTYKRLLASQPSRLRLLLELARFWRGVDLALSGSVTRRCEPACARLAGGWPWLGPTAMTWPGLAD